MYRTLTALISAAFLLLYAGCSSFSSTQSDSPQVNPENVVATIGNNPVMMDDLINYYERNNLEEEYSEEDIREFLPFYVDYKLKLAYGRDKGMMEDPEILSEYDNYSKQAAFSYWLENDIKKQLLDDFIYRNRYEMKSQHVLIQLDERSPAQEEERVLAQIEEAREKFISGEMSMEELDETYSSRMQGRSVGGDLPWFSAGTTVKPFEDALYSLAPGEISEPVRTQFGYHLIYLEEKRERIPDRLTSHIFFREPRGNNSLEQLSQQAYEALESGRPWDEVVREFSQDGASANSGGEIGWIGYGQQFTAEFIGEVMDVDPTLPYSSPLQTNYGYHILRIDSVRTYRDEDHRIAELTQQFNDLPRNAPSRQQVLERLADIGDLQINSETTAKLDPLFASADTTLVTDLNVDEAVASEVLITFDNHQYTVDDFFSWLIDTNDERRANNYSGMWLDLYEDYLLDSRVIEMTRKEFDTFDREIEGFLNGLVVFQVSDENIWSSDTADSTALKEYFEENRERYMFDQRYDYTLLGSRSDSTLNSALNRLHSGENPTEFVEEFEGLLVVRDSVATPSEEIMSALSELEEGQISEAFTYRNRTSHVILNQILEPREMTFDEAFHRVSSDYQPMREELFMNRLRSEYNVQTYPERIRLN